MKIKRFLAQITTGLMIVSVLLPPPFVRAEDVLSDVDPAPAGEITSQSSPELPIDHSVTPTTELSPATVQLPEASPPHAAAPAIQLSSPQLVSAQAEITPPLDPTPQPFAVAADEPVIVSAFKITPNYGFDFVELHNTTNAMASVENVTVHLLYSTLTPAADYDCQIDLHGYVRPGSYVTYSTHTEDGNGAYHVDGCPVPNAPLFDKEIQISRSNNEIESVRIAAGDMTELAAKQWERGGWTTTYRSGIFSKDFKSPVAARDVYTSGLYELPAEPSLQFLEIFPHSPACSSGDASPTCRPYIKVKNTGSNDIDLGQFRLRNGTISATSSKYNTSSLSGVIKAGDFATIMNTADNTPLAISDEDGATWLEDAFGLTTYTNVDTPYQDAELVAQKGKSWALDAIDNVWKWAIPSPFSEQNFFGEPGAGDTLLQPISTLKPCADNQYRSSETNRCHLLSSTTTTTLKPCKEGQYRSEETNRCRSIASAAAAVLKPCADDQFRNPASGRCKKIASTDDIIQPCSAGKERNPATNRCRNSVSTAVPQSAFAVEPVKQGIKSFVGWWALGGIGIVAAGYGAWEWRRELAHMIQKVATFTTHGK